LTKRKLYLLDEETILNVKLLALKAGKTESKYVNDMLTKIINESKKGEKNDRRFSKDSIY